MSHVQYVAGSLVIYAKQNLVKKYFVIEQLYDGPCYFGWLSCSGKHIFVYVLKRLYKIWDQQTILLNARVRKSNPS